MPNAEESKPPESPLWMLTFTDAMTNMLTFFILMLTFAALGSGSHAQQGGFGPPDAGRSIFDKQAGPPTGAVVEAPTPVGQTPELGSEKPTSLEELGGPGGRPREPIGILDTDAYADRKVFYLPSRLVFYGWGSYVTEGGQDRLNRLAEFLRADASCVIIGESSGLPGNHPRFGKAGISVDRSWAVMQYLTGKANLPARRVGIAAVPAVPEGRYPEPVVEITLLSRSLLP